MRADRWWTSIICYIMTAAWWYHILRSRLLRLWLYFENVSALSNRCCAVRICCFGCRCGCCDFVKPPVCLTLFSFNCFFVFRWMKTHLNSSLLLLLFDACFFFFYVDVYEVCIEYLVKFLVCVSPCSVHGA